MVQAARCKYRTQKIAKIATCTIAQLCPAIYSQLRHVSTIGKNSLNINTSSICHHSMVNFGPIMAEICWRVCGTLENFNRFRVLASLLHRRRSTEVNKTLQDVWLSPGLVHYTVSQKTSHLWLAVTFVMICMRVCRKTGSV